MRVLITPVLPDANRFPGLLSKQFTECILSKNRRFLWFAVTVRGMDDTREQPHGGQWNGCPKRVTRFRDQTATTRLKNAKHLGDRAPMIRKDGENSRSDENIK